MSTDESANSQVDGSVLTYTGPGGTSGSGVALTGTPTAQTAATAFVDDAIMQSVTFGGTTLSALRPALAAGQGGAQVVGSSTLINPTYGDSDTNTDGNNTPFAKSGNPGLAYSGTTAPTQTAAQKDAAIQAAYNSLSLTEGISSPGQGGTAGAVDYTFSLLFQEGIVDNNVAADSVPELVQVGRKN